VTSAKEKELRDILEQIFAYDKAFPGSGVEVMLDTLMGRTSTIRINGQDIIIKPTNKDTK